MREKSDLEGPLINRSSEEGDKGGRVDGVLEINDDSFIIIVDPTHKSFNLSLLFIFIINSSRLGLGGFN